MSKKNKQTAAPAKPATVVTPTGNVPPSNLPEELLPVYDWYKAKGRDFLLTLAIAVIAVAAIFAFKNFRQRQNMEASAALLTATDTQSLDNLANQYGKTAIGPVIRLRLARSYFEDGNYEASLNACDLFLKKDRKHQLAPEAKLCRAAALEALEKYDDAIQAYMDLAKDPASFVAPSAVLGQARCLAAKDDKAGANALLDQFVLDRKGTKWEAEAENLRGVIARFQGFKDVSLFDRLGDAPVAPAASQETVPAAEAAEEVVPEAKDTPAAETNAPAAAEEKAAPAAK